ncbi:SDR family NAD(P)-dependent oxidoreductase [Synechococcus sp. ROS8604]|uniref:SDR family NAD(P)-dependent oxidoreductase n=1 Tax=Synechococcus sp. ROS8604 TaxID=1442557 RepID=UPI001645A3F7|nr:SDR family NAD(P)-dependent oxidoreductase [Synechococcus sp. ROS8604]QNI86969.1 CDP-paratose 2-epimerase [Synechococcus sp. ROS8604]
MKVLITGGCGFLGSNLAAHYLSKQCQVIVIDGLFRLGSSDNLSWLAQKAASHNSSFDFVQGDIADNEVVLSVFRRYGPFDFVVHVGGQVAMTTSLSDPSRDMYTNVVGTFNILEAVRLHSPNALLAYSSTNKVYGDLEHLRYEETSTRYKLPDFPNGLDENLPLDFSTPYGCSKGSADQYVRDWSRVYGLSTVVFRHSSIFGGRQFASFDQGWIGWFCKKSIEQMKSFESNASPEPFTIAGTGKQVRDVLHVDDLITLYSSAFENKSKLNGEIFNIGGGFDNSLSLLELFSLLSDINRIPHLQFISTPRRASDQDCFIADIRKAHQILGWAPKVSCQQGVSNMVEWTKSLSF